VLDLREHSLPLYNEPTSALYTGGAYSEPAAEAWRLKIGATTASSQLPRNTITVRRRAEKRIRQRLL